MKVTLVAVISIDGLLTKGSDSNIHKWTSKEDHDMHTKLLSSNMVIIMGRKTYSAWKLKPTKNRLVIVQTRSPEKYKDINVVGQLEFTKENAKELITRLKKQGIKEVIVDGGGEINAEFMSSGLVTDLLITIEPYVFGSGIKVFNSTPQDIKLKLVNSEVLNSHGTLLLHYKVI